MPKIKVVQVGLGPLGIKTANFIAERAGVDIVAAVDKNPTLVGKDLGELCGAAPSGVIVMDDFAAAVAKNRPDVAVLTTVSDMARITPQLLEIVAQGIPVVSTCEELSYPWDCAPEWSRQIDEAAKANNVAVVGTGVNPGFLMDSLPTFLTAVCQDVSFVKISRYQDAQFRRIPFQQKIGAGLTLGQFDQKKADGSLRHVGLTESMQFIAGRMGWKLDKTEDIIEAVVANAPIKTAAMEIPAGNATGVRQTGNAYVNGELKIQMIFQATVGEPESYDLIEITGNPNIHSKIQGGVNGDVATCAIVVNTLPQILRSTPGLKTMGDIPLVSFFS